MERGPVALRLAARGIAWVAIGGLLVYSVAMLAAALLGFERYVVTGDSMSGSIERGSLLFSETVPVSDLRVGDVITYQPPDRAGERGLVTHRIVSVKRDGEGRALYRTRGDANPSPDPWRFTLPGPEQARASLAIPYAGYPFALLGIREVRMLLIGLPALVVAAVLVTGLWRDAGREARELTEIARARGGAVGPGG